MPLLLNKYTIGAIVFIMSLAASSWLSYDYGTSKVRLEWANERIELDKATRDVLIVANEKNKLLADKLSKLDVELDTKFSHTETQTVEVEKEVIKYVKEYVTGTCPIDTDRLRIKNRAITITQEFAKPSISPVM